MNGQTEGKSSEEVRQLSEELHGKATVTKLSQEIEEMWQRCGEHIDNALSQMAKAKMQHMDIGIVCEIPKV